MTDAPSDIIFHHPPALFNLVVDIVPLLNRSKQDVQVFFQGARVSDIITSGIAFHLSAAQKDVNKYQMVHPVLESIIAKGEQVLREWCEMLRVVDFSNFDSCWLADQLKTIVHLLKQQDDVSEFFTKKVRAAQIYKAPYFCPPYSQEQGAL